jgi:hypothetical protein
MARVRPLCETDAQCVMPTVDNAGEESDEAVVGGVLLSLKLH